MRLKAELPFPACRGCSFYPTQRNRADCDVRPECVQWFLLSAPFLMIHRRGFGRMRGAGDPVRAFAGGGCGSSLSRSQSSGTWATTGITRRAGCSAISRIHPQRGRLSIRSRGAPRRRQGLSTKGRSAAEKRRRRATGRDSPPDAWGRKARPMRMRRPGMRQGHRRGTERGSVGPEASRSRPRPSYPSGKGESGDRGKGIAVSVTLPLNHPSASTAARENSPRSGIDGLSLSSSSGSCPAAPGRETLGGSRLALTLVAGVDCDGSPHSAGVYRVGFVLRIVSEQL